MSGPPDKKLDLANNIISMLPDGTVLQFPKGTDPAVIDKVYRKRLGEMQAAKPPAQKSGPEVGTGEAFGIGTSQGILANFGDEAAAAIGATIGRPGGEALPGETWPQRYDAGLGIARAKLDAAKEQHPYAYGSGQVTGAVATTLALPGAGGAKFVANAPTMAGMMGRSALVGGGYGTVYGFGEGEGGFENRTKDAALGGATGAIIGAVAPPVAKAVGGAIKGVKNWAVDSLWPKVAITEAPKAATMGVADAAAAPSASIMVKPSQVDKATAKIAEALRRDGYSQEQITRILDALGPEGTLADVGPNAKTLLTSAMGAPGAGKQIGATALENRQALEQTGLLSSLDKTLGVGAGFHQTDDQLIAALEKEASPLYGKAFSSAQPVNTTPVMEAIDKAVSKMPAKSSIRSALERVRGLLGEEVSGPDGKPMFKGYDDLEMLHNAKLSIDDMLSKFTGDDSLGNVAKRKVIEVKSALLAAMEELNPAYTAAREKFSGTMTSLDALKAGRAFIKEDAEITAAALRELDLADQQFFREGAKRAIADIIKSKPQDVSVVQLLRKTGLLEKVKALVPGEAEFNAFVQDLNNARTFANTRAYATGGSQTVEKTLAAMDLANNPIIKTGQDVATGNKAGLVRSALDWVGQLTGPGEETRAAIVKALLSNNRPEVNETVRRAMLAQQLMALENQAIGTGAAGGSATGASYGDALLGRKAGPR